MKLSHVVHVLPPLRVLIGAAFAFASYFVTSVWKADVDDKISGYNDVIGRITATETRLNALPSFEAYTHYWSNLIELQRLQIAIFNQSINAEKPLPAPVIDPDKNRRGNRAVDRHELYVRELISRLPPAVLDQPAARTDSAFDKKWWWLNDTTPWIKACMEEETIKGKGESYRTRLAAIYQEEAGKVAELSRPALTFRESAAAQLKRLELSDRVATLFNSHFNPRIPSPNPFYTEDVAVFAAVKTWDLGCLDLQKEFAYERLSDFLRQLRTDIADNLLKPLQQKKRRIQDAEIFLYVASGLIALFGSRPAPTNAPPVPPPDASAARNAAAERRRKRRQQKDRPPRESKDDAR